MLRRYDVLCVGSAVVDRFLQVERPLSSIKLGDKVLVTEQQIHSGGGATNAAAALSKLGVKVKMLTKLGDDHDAKFIEREMKQYKVKNICVRRSNKSTNSSAIVSSSIEKDRIIYAFKGASQDLTQNDFKQRQLNAKWIYLATLMGKSFHTAKKIASYAQRKKINVLFNPSLYLAKKGKRYLKEILQATTLLVLNKEEAQALLNTSKTSFPYLLKELHSLGPSSVVITNGTKRFYGLHEKTMYSLIPPKVKRVNTAGAGDAFTAGLLSELIKGHKFSEGMRVGQANASSVIQHVGTKNKLLSEKEAHALIKKYRIRCKGFP